MKSSAKKLGLDSFLVGEPEIDCLDVRREFMSDIFNPELQNTKDVFDRFRKIHDLARGMDFT